MKNKFRIIVPLCLILVITAAMLGIRSMAVEEVEPKQASAVTVAAVEAQNVEAPARNLETLAPIKTISETDETLDPEEETRAADSGYDLTDQERIAVECAVMCEAGGESVKGQMMVAQCILDGTLRNGYTVAQTIQKYQIVSTSYNLVTDEVKESVSRVFDDGERVTEEKADLWYNPALVVSAWHEQQQYVVTVGSHRFFWMNTDMT